MTLPTCAILCGGLGTRLAPLTDNTPKSLVEVAGKPFLAHQLSLLRLAGITNVVLCLGHLGSAIKVFILSHSLWGIDIKFSHDGSQQLGTAGALRKALPLLGDEFFVLYGDSYLPGVDYQAVYERFKASEKPALMTIKENEDRRHKNNVILVDGNLRYELFLEMLDGWPTVKYIDYGLSIVKSEIFGEGYWQSADLPQMYGWLSRRKLIASSVVTTPMLGIGNHESLAEMQAFMEGQKA